MYGKGSVAGALPVTGLVWGWQVVLAVTLIVAGFALVRMFPKRSRNNS